MINNYYLIEDGQQTGPFSHIDLMDRGIDPDTQLLSPISNQWETASSLPEFANYFQSQGIYSPESSKLAGFWWRLLAYVIDYVLLFLVLVALGVLLGLVVAYTSISVNFGDDDYQLKERLLSVLVFVFYNAILEATKVQGSIGKAVCKLKVVDALGRRIGFSTSLRRNAAKLLSSLVCGMGFLNVLWDKQRQGWHDQIAKTYVVRIT